MTGAAGIDPHGPDDSTGPDGPHGPIRPTRDGARAARWAGRLMRPGPELTGDEARRVVARLRAAADRALPLARAASGLAPALEAAAAAPGGAAADAPVLVVDRPGWARAAAASFAAVAGAELPGGPAGDAQLAAALAMLGTRVLGQYDPYLTSRLLLVAPNVVSVGRAMGADEDEFALWVCVHEQTHALQFAAAPWLAGHLRDQAAGLLGAIVGEDEAAATGEGRPGGARGDSFLDAVRSLRGGGSPLTDLLGADQQERLDSVTAVMSLLEGHADVTMDEVPRHALPHRGDLRRRMTERREKGGMAAVLRRVLGMDAKLAQYRQGATFVRAVRAARPDALDAAWASPDALPTLDEIADPGAWLARTGG